MKDFFTPEDFEGTHGHYQKELHEAYCKIANEKLNKLIESWPVVYGNFVDSRNWTKHETSMDTHTARLAFIEEIKKEPCKHEPLELRTERQYVWAQECKHCGVELQATWSEKK